MLTIRYGTSVVHSWRTSKNVRYGYTQPVVSKNMIDRTNMPMLITVSAYYILEIEKSDNR